MSSDMVPGLNGHMIQRAGFGYVGVGQDGGEVDTSDSLDNANAGGSNFTQLSGAQVPETASSGSSSSSGGSTSSSGGSSSDDSSALSNVTSSLADMTSGSLLPWLIGGAIVIGGAAAYEWYKHSPHAHPVRRALRHR